MFKKLTFGILCFIILSNFLFQFLPILGDSEFVTKNNINTVFQVLQTFASLGLSLTIFIYNLIYFKQTSILTKITGFCLIFWNYIMFSGNFYLIFGVQNLLFSMFIRILGSLILLWAFWQTFLRKYNNQVNK